MYPLHVHCVLFVKNTNLDSCFDHFASQTTYDERWIRIATIFFQFSSPKYFIYAMYTYRRRKWYSVLPEAMLMFLDTKYFVQIYLHPSFMTPFVVYIVRCCRCTVREPIHGALLHPSWRVLRSHQELGLQGHGVAVAHEHGRAQSQRAGDGEERVWERGGGEDIVC